VPALVVHLPESRFSCSISRTPRLSTEQTKLFCECHSLRLAITAVPRLTPVEEASIVPLVTSDLPVRPSEPPEPSAKAPWSSLSGLAFTTLAFGPPIVHLGAPLRGLELILAALPLVALVFHHFRAAPFLSHFAFPCAHLPLLLARPELSGPEVYGGLRGLIALLLLILTFVIFLLTTTRDPRTLFSSLRALPLMALAFALAPASALALAVLGTEGAPDSAALALLPGPLVALYVVTLAPPRATRAALISALAARSRPRTSILVTTALLALVAIAACAFWLFWSPR